MDTSKFEPKGFFVNETFPVSNVAYLSLSIALKAYLSTFKDIQDHVSSFSCPTRPSNSNLYGGSYIEHVCEAITHFQHFVELYIKDILKDAHPLLVVDASSKPVLLYDILANQNINSNSLDELKQIEFKMALKCIVDLLKYNKLDPKYNFILQYKDILMKVNKLRNRIAHRGIYILEYESLDELFGKYILPFLIEIFAIETSKEKDFYFKKTKNGFSPLDLIINHFETRPYNIKEIGLLKEIARATNMDEIYDNDYLKTFNEEKIQKLEAIASFEENRSYGSKEICTCPVCNQKTFLLDWERVDNEDENHNVTEVIDFVYVATCLNCTFEIRDSLWNVKVDNFDLSPYLKSERR